MLKEKARRQKVPREGGEERRGETLGGGSGENFALGQVLSTAAIQEDRRWRHVQVPNPISV